MAFFQTDLPNARWSGQKLADRPDRIDGALDASWREQLETLYLSAEQAREQWSWLQPKALQLLVDSGSRGDQSYLVWPVPSADSLYPLAQTRQAQGREMAHELHGQVERGSPVRVFRGPRFEP